MAAGLGYKEFTTGDVLTAADANGYLASQVVMVFASSAARTSAIASPQEGMISFLKDTNSTEYYSGSAWVAIGGSSSPTFVGCALYKTSNQSIGNASEIKLTFDSEYFDTDGYHSTVTNTSRITIPTGKGGKYLITAEVNFDANATGSRMSQIMLNNSSYISLVEVNNTGASRGVGIIHSFIYNLNQGDYIEVNAYQASGGNLNVLNGNNPTLFSVTYLGA